jgi:ferredoxin
MKEAIIDIPCPSLHSKKEEHSLLQRILDLKIPISHSCGGNGTCGTCRLIVIEGAENLSPREDHEIEFAESRGFSDTERLACQCHLIGRENGVVKVQICQLDN